MFITTSTALQEYCHSIAQAKRLFIDTEFVRESTYYPILSLIQVADEHGDAVAIDVMASGMDLTPLLDIIYDSNIEKVLHAGRQDIEIFVQLRGSPPPNLFDTQIAAMMLGMGEQIGYEALIRDICNIQVDKSQQHSRWGKRPLSAKQLHYALSDVIHLRSAYPVMITRLKERGRQDWVYEEVGRLLADPAIYTPDPDMMWKRFRLKGNRRHYLARLQALAAMRERYAMGEDIARSRVMKDELLHYIALSNVRSEADLLQMKNIDQSLFTPASIYACIEAANALPDEECPKLERNVEASGDDMVRDSVKLLLKFCADEHQVSQGIICDKKSLYALLADDASSMALSGWRYELFGKRVQRWLNGQCQLSVQNGKLALSNE